MRKRASFWVCCYSLLSTGVCHFIRANTNEANRAKYSYLDKKRSCLGMCGSFRAVSCNKERTSSLLTEVMTDHCTLRRQLSLIGALKRIQHALNAIKARKRPSASWENVRHTKG